MPTQVHPFTHYQALWERALQRLPAVELQARAAAVEHIRTQVHHEARRYGLDTGSIGVYWRSGQPRLHIEPGPTADQEFGTLTAAPRPIIRNTASRATDSAAGLYQRHIWAGIGSLT